MVQVRKHAAARGVKGKYLRAVIVDVRIEAMRHAGCVDQAGEAIDAAMVAFAASV